MDRYDPYTDKFISDVPDTISRQAAIIKQLSPAPFGTIKHAGLEHPLSDREIIPRLRQIKEQVGGSYAIERAIEVLTAQPETIHCKDCKHFDPIYTGGAGVCGHWNAKTDLEEVGMDELIRRQAAIYIASGYCHPANIAKELAKLPPAEPEQRKEILYRHYKGGIYELVCNNVTHTETGESLVIYRDCRGKLWARPESMFYGLVKVGDYFAPRFVLCQSEGDAE